MATGTAVTAREIAQAAQIAPRTKKFILRDEYGLPYEGNRAELVLAALCRSDKTPDLSARIHDVAYAIRKSLVTARMRPELSLRVSSYTPYRLCQLVAQVVNEAGPDTTVGAIADDWLNAHAGEL